AGDVFTVLGGSGCGKSTLLNILIGVGETPPRTPHVLRQNNPTPPPRQRPKAMRGVGGVFPSGAFLSNPPVAGKTAPPFLTASSQDLARPRSSRGHCAHEAACREARRPCAEVSAGAQRRHEETRRACPCPRARSETAHQRRADLRPRSR